MGSLSLSPQEREAIRQRAEQARLYSRGLVAHCLRVRVEADGHRPTVEATHDYLEVERALRGGVKEFVSLLRRIETPEAAIIEVKDLLRDGIGDTLRPSLIEERRLTDSLVGWAIEDYFAAD